jgi:hypothetical protein
VVDEGKGDLDLDLDLGAQFEPATSVALRVEARDPSGRAFAYVSPTPVLYVSGPTPDSPVPPDYDYCDEPAALEPQDCPTGGDASSGGETDDTAAGCSACRTGRPALDTVTLFVLLLGGLRRRGRSSPSSPT